MISIQFIYSYLTGLTRCNILPSEPDMKCEKYSFKDIRYTYLPTAEKKQ
jgi:hypothetical protein